MPDGANAPEPAGSAETGLMETSRRAETGLPELPFVTAKTSQAAV